MCDLIEILILYIHNGLKGEKKILPSSYPITNINQFNGSMRCFLFAFNKEIIIVVTVINIVKVTIIQLDTSIHIIRKIGFRYPVLELVVAPS